MAVVVGLGATGTALTRHLVATGHSVTVVDDRPADGAAELAGRLGAELVVAPGDERLRALVAGADLVLPNPGVPPRHPIFALARELGVPLLGEVELAARQATVPLVAVTGTNGKTTVTTLIAAMLEADGRRVVAAGNIGFPLIEAVFLDLDVIVVEVSSAQLATTDRFHPKVAVWLNLAENHLDWHPDMEDYAAAKARIWANQGPGDTAVANAADPIVMGRATGAQSALVTFGGDAGYREEGGRLLTPAGQPIVDVAELPRAMPHDISNALAAVAGAVAAGAAIEACARALTSFSGLPHRVALVGESGGVRWYDDSKATTPSSVVAALRCFPSVVLIAGGRNKGTDLGVLRGEAARVRAVVAIGDAADDVVAAFDGVAVTERADSMDDAVTRARAAAQPGDVVLLSPGCASFDWYRSYGERGDDFARAVNELVLT